LACGDSEWTVKLWNVESQKVVTKLQRHSNSADLAAFWPDGKHLVSGGEDKAIKL
jgi:WD40 repeat protein